MRLYTPRSSLPHIEPTGFKYLHCAQLCATTSIMPVSTLIFQALLGFMPVNALMRNATPPKCFCTPNQSCWPSSSALTAFSKTLSSPSALIQVHPSGYACHDPHYNSTACSIANASQADPVWIASQPGSMQNLAFESSIFGNSTSPACSFNTTESTPCGQGSVPSFGVNVTVENDVVRALEFANKHNLRVVMKNSGWVIPFCYKMVYL